MPIGHGHTGSSSTCLERKIRQQRLSMGAFLFQGGWGMELGLLIVKLSRNATVFRELMAGLSEKQARWKPETDRWSLLEVINHLHDEEREDFRTRLDLVLHYPTREWPPIDPINWVTSRKYNQADVHQSSEDFLTEREWSLKWLGELSTFEWDAEHTGSVAGTLRAGDLVVSWVAHDFFHIRQMTGLHWEYLNTASTPYSTEYAGPVN